MKIIAIDPGYERLGIAILEKNTKEELIFSDCIQTKKTLPHFKRLAIIQQSLEKIIDNYKPEALSIETLFFNTNQKTATNVAEARGVIISTCAVKGLDVFEVSPLQVKVAVTGHGRSDKTAVIKMIPHLIKINKTIKYDDEYDAIAVGLAYFAMNHK